MEYGEVDQRPDSRTEQTTSRAQHHASLDPAPICRWNRECSVEGSKRPKSDLPSRSAGSTRLLNAAVVCAALHLSWAVLLAWSMAHQPTLDA